MMTHYLAIDLGAESGRVIYGSLEAGRLQLEEVHRFANGPVRTPDGLHWDVLRLWSEIKQGIALAVRKHGQDIAGLGLDTWGVDFGLLDRNGALLGNPYHYRDSRNDGMLEEAFRLMPREQIFEHTGIQFMQINTLFQLLSMVKSGAPALQAADTLLMMPDLFNYWLTGVKVSEFSIVSTSQCYDPRQAGWSQPLLQAMGIPTHIFAPIVQPGTVLGPLLPAVAHETGAGAIQVIAPACHDTGSAVAAVPATESEFAWISSGTWSLMGTDSAIPIITPQSLAFNLTNEGGVNGSIRLLKNITGLWLVQECRRTWAAQGEELSYAELTDLADLAAPLRSLIDPDAPEFASPTDMPERIRAYCSRTAQPVPESKGEIIRCALESLALSYRNVLAMLESVTGRHMQALHIMGGGTRNRLLNQFAANATGLKVITGPVEATAIGNILMQAIALGHLASLVEARQVVCQSFDVETYQPQDRQVWDLAYRRFTDIMALNVPGADSK
jgi:rhamnulokinase